MTKAFMEAERIVKDAGYTVYNLVSMETGEIVGSTKISPFDSDCLTDEEILWDRLDAAIDEGYIKPSYYEWIPGTKMIGERL